VLVNKSSRSLGSGRADAQLQVCECCTQGFNLLEMPSPFSESHWQPKSNSPRLLPTPPTHLT